MAAETYRIEIPIEAQDRTDPGVSSAQKKLSAFDRVNEKTQQRLEKMSKSKFAVALDAVDRASAVVQKVGSTLKRFTSKAWNVTMKAVDMVTAPVRGIFKLFTNPLFQIGAAIGVTIGVKDTIDTYVGFEKSMSRVKGLLETTSQDIAGDMGMLSEKAREMGKATTKSASEAADAMGYMALAGWDAGTIMTAIEPVLRLSEAGEMDLARASDLVTDSMSSLGLGADELTGYLDKVAKTAATSNTDVDMLMEAFMECGGTVNRLKMPLSEAAGLLGVLANRGVKGSEAGTALNSILVNLTATSGQSADAMAELGLSAFDAEGNFRGYATVLKDLYGKTKDMTDEQQNYYLSAIGMKMRMSDLQKFLAGVSEEYDTLTAGIEDSDGALLKMAETMNDNLYGDFKAFTSALDEVKIAFTDKLQPNLRAFVQWFTGKMPDLQKAAGDLADGINEKIRWLQETIADFTGSDEWAGADLWGKLAIAWDKIVAEPFGEWWDGTGRQWMTEKASDIGRGLGGGITAGLLGLLGIDLSGAAEDGKSLGASFVTGFQEGFDTEKITAALKEWAGDHKGVVAGLGVIVGGKLLGGLARGLSTAKGLFSRGGSAGGGSVGGLSTMTTATMRVNAGVVNVYGMNTGGAARGAAGAAGSVVRNLTGGAPALAGGGASALGGGTLALPGAAGGAAGGGQVVATVLKNGATVAGTGGAITEGLATVGTTLGSATTMGGAAALGGASILGGVVGLAGIGSGIYDIYQGTQQEDAKAQKDAYFQGGTKIAMVGAGAGGGAAAGAAIGALFGGVGAIPGALIGAGIGGVGALLGGDKAGKALSDATDEGGWLSNTWENIKTGAGQAWESVKEGAAAAGGWVADKWNQAGDWVSEKWNGLSSWFDETVWTPIKDLGVSAVNIAVGAWDEAKSFVSDSWSDFSSWFDESVWTPVQEGVQTACNWVGDRWDEAKTWVSETWNSFSGWFDETVWTPVREGAQVAASWINDRWNEAKTWVSETWSSFSGWFDETVWMPVREGAQAAASWINDRWEEAKTWVSETWNSFSGWFDETVWTPVKEGAQAAGEWIGDRFEDAKTGLKTAWDGVSGWFSDNVWGPIKNAAGSAWETVKGKWEDIKSWGAGLGQRGSEITGLTTSEGKGSVLEGSHAWGGIMDKPHIGLVAEAGPESIIPLSPSKRERGLELWERTGNLLGVQPYANWRETAPDAAARFNGRGAEFALEAHAWGGIMDKPHIGLVAEAGPESIIPLSPSKRERGLELWEQTGALLGVTPYADGGVAGGTAAKEPLSPVTGGAAAASAVQVTIPGLPQITVNVEQQDSPERVAAIVRERLIDMVDDIGGALAEQLAPIFANMPKRGGA